MKRLWDAQGGQGSFLEIRLQSRNLNFTGAQKKVVKEMKVTTIIKV